VDYVKATQAYKSYSAVLEEQYSKIFSIPNTPQREYFIDYLVNERRKILTENISINSKFCEFIISKKKELLDKEVVLLANKIILDENRLTFYKNLANERIEKSEKILNQI